MRKFIAFFCIFAFMAFPLTAQSKSPVIEESYWHVPSENRDEFLSLYAKYWKPFWEEARKMDLVVDGIRIYAHRIHTKDHTWTFKTVVKFKNYDSIDKWLKNRDAITQKLFPEYKTYKKMGYKIKKLTNDELHWDEFIRELKPRP